MNELDQRIAQVAEELKRLEEEMRRAGLAVTPEMARARHWELSRCMTSSCSSMCRRRPLTATWDARWPTRPGPTSRSSLGTG